MLRKTIIWLIILSLSAVATHTAAKYLTPRMIMHVALDKITTGYATATNQLSHGAQITSRDRRVVRPSPDLAYSICVFDLQPGQNLAITIPKRDKYLSVAFYDANTNNFFHLNDTQIETNSQNIVLSTDEPKAGQSLNSDVIYIQAPTQRGLVLFRAMVENKNDWLELEATRAQMSCEL
ncbi:MAG: DUF1254 domain-containing protein [Pseudomonadota bacterium]